jgi:hypothetical protein
VKYTPPETDATQQFTNNLRPGTTITAYLTNDSFEQVLAFYKGLAKKYTSKVKLAEVKLPNGEEIKKTFLIFDGASDLLKSKTWISIQRPFVGSVTRKDGQSQYSDIRDVTEVVLTEKKDVPRETEQNTVHTSPQ